MASPAEANKLSASGIGDKLREAREKRALTIEQVQKQTRIHSTVISALEEGRSDEILAPNYIKSFLKEYANFLGLDSRALVDAYIASRPELNDQAKMSKLEVKSTAIEPSAVISVLKRTIILLVVVFLAVLLVKKAVVIIKSHKTGKTGIAQKVSKTKDARKASSKVDIAIKEIPRSTPMTLVIKVKRPVTVQAKRDGVLLFKRLLQKGAVESLTAKESINIFVAKAESIELILNGKNLGSPGKGTIRNLEITRSGVKIR